MNGEYKLLWATDVGAHHEAEHMGMEVFACKADAEAHPLVTECGERPIPIIVFVPFEGEDTVLAASKALQVVNTLNMRSTILERLDNLHP